MRGSPNTTPSTWVIVLLMLLAMGAVFKHATVTPTFQLVMDAALVAIVVATMVALMKYHGVSAS